MFNQEKEMILACLNILQAIAYPCPGADQIKQALISIHNRLNEIEKAAADKEKGAE